MYTRWLVVASDMIEVVAVENACYVDPWSESDFVRALRERSTLGMVAEHDNQVVGYMIYELRKNDIHVLNIAVHPNMRRQIIGATLIQKLIVKLSHDRRRRIIATVRDSNYQAHLFFKSLGFFCTKVVRDYYEDNTESGYRFEYDVCPPTRLLLTNRVSQVQQQTEQQ